MQAVMLLAGEGTRMRPLTYTVPKPLLKISNQTILEHNLNQLKQNGIDDIVLVVGYMKEQIKNFLEKNSMGMNFKFVPQDRQLGTGHALLQAEKLINEKNFLVIYGDDYYHHDDIKKCLESDLCVTAKEVADPSRFGVFTLKNGFVNSLIEKPTSPTSNLANTGLYNLNTDIFNLIKDVTPSERNEIELTEAIKKLIVQYSIDCKFSDNWIPIGYPWDLLTANEMKMQQLEDKNYISNDATVEENATLKGFVKVGKNTIIKGGSYIEGPVVIGDECVIGPNCYVRPFSSIGNDCRIGNSVEIKNSIIGNETHIEHLSYIGDSIIGSNCNLGSGAITANLRHDNKTILVNVKGTLVDTHRRKFGVVMGDYTKTGIRTSFYQGTMLGPFTWTVPGTIIKENIDPLVLFDGTTKKELSANKISNNPDILEKIELIRSRLIQ